MADLPLRMGGLLYYRAAGRRHTLRHATDADPANVVSDKAIRKVTTSYNGQFPNTLIIKSPWPELAGLNIANVGNDLGYVHSGGGTTTLAVQGVTPVSLNLIATTQITVVVEYNEPEAP